MSFRIRKILPLLAFAGVVLLAVAAWQFWQRFADPSPWSVAEREIIESLWIARLPPVPPDPSNAVADNPLAAEFGHRLFFDPRLSANGAISCSTCHQPIRNFSDGLPRGVAIGMSRRNTPSIVGTAYSPWLYWDGRRDSQWAQALSPLEDPNEHGSSRMQVLDIVAGDPDYRRLYEQLYGAAAELDRQNDLENAFANVGKAIAAYERLLLPGESRFDHYVAHLAAGGDYLQQEFLSKQEIHGLGLFIGDARCTECHNGPLLTNNEFHNTGLLTIPGELPDRGRIDGIRLVRNDPFNCLGAYSDDPEQRCDELRYARDGAELIGATRTPSLRNLGATAPFQSRGQMPDLSASLLHYSEAPLAMIGHNEAEALDMSAWQLRQLQAFLEALAAPLNTEQRWLSPPEAPKP